MYSETLVRKLEDKMLELEKQNRVLGQEITERKRAYEALRASEERHRTILQTAMDGIWTVDLQGHLLEVNETYCRMSGYSTQELLTMHIPELEVTEAAADTAVHIQKIMAQGEDRFEFRHRRKDGTTFDVEVSVQYEPGEGGQIVAFLHDITVRKQAGEQLQHTLESLRNAVSATIQIMTATVEARDPYTAGHQLRSADLARAIATEGDSYRGPYTGRRGHGGSHGLAPALSRRPGH